MQATAARALTVRGSVAQVQVTGAAPASRMILIGPRGVRLQSRRATMLGGVVFRDVPPGSGYRVRTQSGVRSRALAVLSARPKPPSGRIYRQRLPAGGYGYLTTRDGTRLAVNVLLPGPASAGPYPTLVEYSGYGYANPAGGQSSLSAIAKLLGYAVVDVNMRGTGCSGGAFDYFEPLQALDGYDVIETVARQPWTAHHRVGMMGISYGGISQLFVAATKPPSLTSIAPLSVIDDTATTLYPGGILNTGFALSWAKERVHDARPASATGGQQWALERIRHGDNTCRANQVLHASAVNLLRKITANRYYVPAVADPVAPVTFVQRINVPVFLACQWTDEQTGGHCADLAQRFSGTAHKWFTFTNGTHIDSLDPATFTRWFDFLELFVARRAPHLPALANTLAPSLFDAVLGIPGVTLPDDPLQHAPDYATALAAFERLAPVRVLFDNGAGGVVPGAPGAGFEQGFARWPPPGTRASSWFLRGGGLLAPQPPRRAGSDGFTENPGARPAVDFTGDTGGGPGGLWRAVPGYNWVQPPPGSALSYVSAPLAADTTVIGGGALQTWVRASVPRVDLQATISEVRPDGIETFVQNGWLRADARRLDPRRSTLLTPVPSLRRADATPLPAGRWARLTIPLYYEGHVYRAGSRLRITVQAPGGDQPIWAFAAAQPRMPAAVALARSPAMPSRLVLPVVGVSVPTALPPCPGLRGEPCRAYRPLVNPAG
ncbi:MAG: hypothetical protein NVSMB51_07610 [Solirubrobacteraceae bacterium]